MYVSEINLLSKNNFSAAYITVTFMDSYVPSISISARNYLVQ